MRRNHFFELQFSGLEPKKMGHQPITGRLYRSPKALWKLNWFLRDFGYDNDLRISDEVYEKERLGCAALFASPCGTSWSRVSES
jgi:hypothetical protein